MTTKTKTETTAKKAARKAQPKAKAPRYDEAASTEIAQRLAAAKERGFNRGHLRELTGLTDSAVWRAQRGRVHPGEVATLTTALERIESGEVAAPARRTGGARRTAELVALVEQARAAKTLRETHALLDAALAKAS